MKFRTTLFLLSLLLTVSLVAQDSFVRSTTIDPPSTYPSGFGATVSGVDLDGDGKLEIYSVDGMTDWMVRLGYIIYRLDNLEMKKWF